MKPVHFAKGLVRDDDRSLAGINSLRNEGFRYEEDDYTAYTGNCNSFNSSAFITVLISYKSDFLHMALGKPSSCTFYYEINSIEYLKRKIFKQAGINLREYYLFLLEILPIDKTEAFHDDKAWVHLEDMKTLIKNINPLARTVVVRLTDNTGMKPSTIIKNPLQMVDPHLPTSVHNSSSKTMLLKRSVYEDDMYDDWTAWENRVKNYGPQDWDYCGETNRYIRRKGSLENFSNSCTNNSSRNITKVPSLTNICAQKPYMSMLDSRDLYDDAEESTTDLLWLKESIDPKTGRPVIAPLKGFPQEFTKDSVDLIPKINDLPNDAQVVVVDIRKGVDIFKRLCKVPIKPIESTNFTMYGFKINESSLNQQTGEYDKWTLLFKTMDRYCTTVYWWEETKPFIVR